MRFFETAGNAIVIAYDDRPVLTTDPWINADAYFGSWAHDYEIAPRQIQAIRDAEYHWFSHGHPDHLNIASLPLLTKGQFLLSDHYAIVFSGNSRRRVSGACSTRSGMGSAVERYPRLFGRQPEPRSRCC